MFVAPGRVNLMGDHTDYNQGFVLPMAIDRACTVSVARGTTPGVRAVSAQLDGEVRLPIEGSRTPRLVEPSWGRFVAGLLHVLAAAGAVVPPVDLEVSSTVPAGSGLSSSSALSVALTLALTDAAGLELGRVEAAKLALAAEVAATGVPGGLMDQLASLYGEEGHALLIDCRSNDVTPVVISDRIAVVVVHSGLPRTLAGSAYAERRAECEAVAARLGRDSLRDVTAKQVADEPRARHVVAENARVLETAAALPQGDLSVLGPLLLASHASLRDDYEVSTPELDLLVDLLVEAGAAGARLTGAGFGGCVVALVQRNHADDVAAKVTRRYADATGLSPHAFVAHAVDGARKLP
ncbi:MAG: galactokinase [Acidimicrobiia bacterium]